MDPITNLTATARIMHAHLEALTPAAMSLVTPCADWTVAELATHVVDNALFFAGAAGADAQPEPGPVTAANAAERHARAADELVSAFGADGVLDQDVATPFGTFPGRAVLGVAFADQLTHCWDLAQALGREHDVPDQLALDALAAWESFINDELRTGGLFGAPQETSSERGIDQLLAFTGRRP